MFTIMIFVFILVLAIGEIKSLVKDKKSIIKNLKLPQLKAVCLFFTVLFDISIFGFSINVFFDKKLLCFIIISLCILFNCILYFVLKKSKDKLNGYAFLLIYLLLSSFPLLIFTFANYNIKSYYYILHEDSKNYNYNIIENYEISLNMFGQCDYYYSNHIENVLIASNDCSFTKKDNKIYFKVRDDDSDKDYNFSCSFVGNTLTCPTQGTKDKKNISLKIL